ncbi:glutamate--tRNA ligase [Taibaiella sp. KBW10]|uniref:glutamate--tRNA ligase n=1 Tax=Taibaiella sp. KBW10 TaxID=2153357 RepID=UPI000F5B4EEB|nr:glutamate--tRNA ligase [Taibaiella sp. KBW10]RQO29998.1 glutamate--tRNA ligase [Taibaiella sp. KBW10]
MENQVRVRFAPSPTGGLHLGGVRTVLFNYLFAKKHKGTFVLRVEDTDQTRFVEGAEDYIFDCLDWAGLPADESPRKPGDFAPYRQSERKPMYRQYAEQLIAQGNAYYAFDTPEELEKMRESLKTTENPSPQYDHRTRSQMRNSLNLSTEEVKALLDAGVPYVVRIKMPENETVHFTDLIRGDISHETNVVDDKVLLKSDGMPTYHLAVVVDDYLMKITHAFRGEEWLPSAPIHIMLWKYLGWEAEMPKWAHLPLILKPDGNGKLSKRDGERLGFPVFAMEWKDPKSGELIDGFKEKGFLPEAFVNLLVMLGWNPGTEQEIFTLEELSELFSLERVHKGGAKFDYEKAKWYNQQHIQRADNDRLAGLVKPYFEAKGISITDDQKLTEAVAMVKERCHLLTDFTEQASFLFQAPDHLDLDAVKPKWTTEKTAFFTEWSETLQDTANAADLEAAFTECAAKHGIKKGELMMPLRIMLVGGKFGPGVFDIITFIGAAETKKRVASALLLLA